MNTQVQETTHTKDPVCGMVVDSEKAINTEYLNTKYFFCRPVKDCWWWECRYDYVYYVKSLGWRVDFQGAYASWGKNPRPAWMDTFELARDTMMYR